MFPEMEEHTSETDLLVVRSLWLQRTFQLHFFRHRVIYMVAGYRRSI